MRSLLYIASVDSYLKTAHYVAEHFRRDGWEVRGIIDRERSALSGRQIAEIGARYPLDSADAEEVLTGAAMRFDVVCLYATGSVLNRMLRLAHEAMSEIDRRPLLVTGYNGVVYEGHLEGMLWRTGADLVCVNSAKDLKIFQRHLTELEVDPGFLVRTGIPYLWHQRKPHGPIRSIAFACQPSVPGRWDERRYLIRRLIDYAERFPDRRVILKPRIKPGEATFRMERFHYQDILAEAFPNPPPNFEVAYEPMAATLARTDLLVTVSSTAAIEAVGRGVRTAILTDLGIKESLGNHYFVGSGLLASFEDLLQDRIPEPRPDWLEENGFGEADTLQTLSDRIYELLDTNPPLRPIYYDEHRAPYIAQAALAPLPSGRTKKRKGPLKRVRKLVKAIVRAGYDSFRPA